MCVWIGDFIELSMLMHACAGWLAATRVETTLNSILSNRFIQPLRLVCMSELWDPLPRAVPPQSAGSSRLRTGRLEAPSEVVSSENAID